MFHRRPRQVNGVVRWLGELMGYDIVSMVPMFCDVFLGASDVEGGLAFPDRIARDSLDYSLESLHSVDRYLDYLHQHADEIEDQEYTNTILAAGCYLGEVVRRCAPIEYQWVNYADYFPNHPKLAKMVPEGVGTSAVLVSAAGAMTMPLNKIARYIGEGPENNTHFYATAEIRPR
jgi:hypothetical protein